MSSYYHNIRHNYDNDIIANVTKILYIYIKCKQMLSVFAKGHKEQCHVKITKRSH